ATEMNSAVRELTHGFDPLHLTESAYGLSTEHRHLTHYQLTAPMIGADGLGEIWATPSLSTTVTMRLHPGARGAGRRDDRTDTVVLNAVVRFDTAAPLDAAPLPGLRELPG